LSQQGKLEAARADLDQSIKIDEKSTAALAARADLLAREGSWKAAAIDLQKRLPEEDQIDAWANVALLLAKADDVGAYRDHGRDMLAKFRDTDDPAIAEKLVRAVSLLRGSDVDLKRLVTLVESSAKQQRTSSARAYLTLALAALRANDDEAVANYIRRAQQDDAYSLQPSSQATALAIQAISEHRAAKPQLADESAAAASTFLKSIPAAKAGDFFAAQSERLAAEILVSEAQRTVE
jgi:hypothetical protein